MSEQHLTYKQRHKSISANVTIEEYAVLAELTRSKGLSPCTYLSQIVRREIAEATPLVPKADEPGTT